MKKKKRKNIVVVGFFSLLFQFYTSRSRVDVEALHNHRFSLFLFPSFLPLRWRTKRKKKRTTRHAELRGKCLKACIIDARFHRETDSSLRVNQRNVDLAPACTPPCRSVIEPSIRRNNVRNESKRGLIKSRLKLARGSVIWIIKFRFDESWSNWKSVSPSLPIALLTTNFLLGMWLRVWKRLSIFAMPKFHVNYLGGKQTGGQIRLFSSQRVTTVAIFINCNREDERLSVLTVSNPLP